jgi:hypothetical protein
LCAPSREEDERAVPDCSCTWAAGTAGAPSITFTSDIDTGIWNPAANTLGFSAAGAEVARIDAAGKLGLGTTSPAARLHAQESASGVGGARIQHTGASSSPANVLQVSNGYAKSQGGANYEILGVYANGFGQSVLSIKDNGTIQANGVNVINANGQVLYA